MPAICAQIPKAVLLMFGVGPARVDLEAQAAVLGMSDHVRLLGVKSQVVVGDYYRVGDVLLSARVSESQGQSYM